MKKVVKSFVIFAMILALAACASQETINIKEIPTAEVDETSMFGVDKNINIENIDEWVGRDDAAYIDVRMLVDPGDYGAIGGDPVLSGTIEGFEVVPYPYLANLTGLPEPVSATQYSGPTLFTVSWDEDGNIDTVVPNFRESEMIINDLFPQDKPIFLLCGGGGYAGFTRALLIELGYNPDLLFNIGGFWGYKGDKTVHIKVSYGENNAYDYNAFHKLNYHLIDFNQLNEN
ncbi:MAG: hypothetical protein GX339_01885 [Tissierellia bacterium]|nr:hypothetical protein [Tissierellia bacterium]